MSEEKVQIMVEGGKASASPQMAQSLGPKGINIKDVLAQINEKTKNFQGMKVPVDVLIDIKSKAFKLQIGTPPTAELIKKEAGIEKGSGKPNVEKMGNLAIEQVIKIAQMKEEQMLVNDFKAAVKNVVGSCNSLGILVESKESKEMSKDIDAKKYDQEILSKKTEVDPEKKKTLEIELKKIQEKLKAEAALKEVKPAEKKEEVKEEVVEEKAGKKDEKTGKKEEKKEVKKKEEKKK